MSVKLLLVFLILSSVFGSRSFSASKIKIRDTSELKPAEKDLDLILAKYLTKYIDLAIYYPRSFFPFFLILPNRSDMPKLIYKDWSKMSKVSLGSGFKEKLKNSIAKIWKNRESSFARANPLKVFSKSINSLSKSVEYLQTEYMVFKNGYDDRLADLLSANIRSKTDFNAELQRIHRESLKSIYHYRSQYLNLTSSHPYKILRTKYMIDLVEGNHFKIEAVDLYNAVRELKETYIKSLIFEFSRAAIKNHEFSKSISFNDSYADSITQAEKPIIPSEVSLMPSLEDDYLFQILTNFGKKDPYLAKLIGQKSLQKVLWELRKKGFSSEAAELESLVYNNFMHPEAIVEILPLGGGVSKSFKVLFANDILGVYKPKAIFNLRQGNANLLAYIAAGYKNEIAAYHMDRLLDLNMVPMTKLLVPHGEKKGSLQYYVKNTHNARELSAINPKFPIKSRKLSKGKGRSNPTNDIYLFDWIIDNVDRNLDNYLIQFDGQFILIDHGFSFVTPFYFQPREHQIKRMHPSSKLAKRIVYLKNHPHLVPRAISHLVGKDIANVVQKRIEYMGKYLETYTQSNPGHKKAIKSSFCS